MSIIDDARESLVNLTDGHELESALCAVDPREYIEILDNIRGSQENLRLFVTHMARFEPVNFMRVARTILQITTWSKIDFLLRENKKIHAIKEIRDMTGLGLREAKRLVDDRVDSGKHLN